MGIQEKFHSQDVQEGMNQLQLRLKDFGISDKTLEAIGKTPRNSFVDCSIAEAWVDKPILIGLIGENEITISQPSVVSLMIDSLQLEKDMTVLEIGTASGWSAGILSHLANEVITVEIDPELADLALGRFNDLGLENIKSIVGDGSDPSILPESVDRIIVSASVKPYYPFPPILRLLSYEGIAVLPLGSDEAKPHLCDLVSYQHTNYGMEIIGVQKGYSFVPMRGKFGWSE